MRWPQPQGGSLSLAGVRAQLGGQLVGDSGPGHDGNTVEEGGREVPEEGEEVGFRNI